MPPRRAAVRAPPLAPMVITLHPWDAPLKAPQGDTARFVDSDGVAWEVTEVPRSPAPQRAGADAPFEPSWLCFRSPQATRKLQPYPQQWEQLSPRQLERLCRRAKLVSVSEPGARTDALRDDRPRGRDGA